MNSPRLPVTYDKTEDFTMLKIRNSSVSHFFTEEAIPEDNNENIVDTEIIHKRLNNSKILENSMDKSEALDNLNIFDLDEIITETIEEDPEDEEDNYILEHIKCMICFFI
jgi:hypothetical protein